jgi:hypothetical protein
MPPMPANASFFENDGALAARCVYTWHILFSTCSGQQADHTPDQKPGAAL